MWRIPLTKGYAGALRVSDFKGSKTNSVSKCIHKIPL